MELRLIRLVARTHWLAVLRIQNYRNYRKTKGQNGKIKPVNSKLG